MKRAVTTALVAGGLILVGAIQSSGNKKMQEARHRNVVSAGVIHTVAIGLHPERKSAKL